MIQFVDWRCLITRIYDDAQGIERMEQIILNRAEVMQCAIDLVAENYPDAADLADSMRALRERMIAERSTLCLCGHPPREHPDGGVCRTDCGCPMYEQNDWPI